MRHNAALTMLRENGESNIAYLDEEERYTSLAARASRKLNRDLRAAMRDGVITAHEARLIAEDHSVLDSALDVTQTLFNEHEEVAKGLNRSIDEVLRAARQSGPQRLTAIA
jgi:hypothetical protein